jgi:hypothetical protein
MRSWILVACWCALSIFLVGFASGTALTAFVVVPCALFAPGIVVVRLLRLRGFALGATVVLLVAIAANVLVPSAFLYAGAWSPRGVFAVIMTATIVGVSLGVVSDAGGRRRLFRTGYGAGAGESVAVSAGAGLRRGRGPLRSSSVASFFPARLRQTLGAERGAIVKKVRHMSASTLARLTSRWGRRSPIEKPREQVPSRPAEALSAPETAAPAQPGATPSAPLQEPPLVMPARVTDAWIKRNVPHMSATTLASFISELWKRNWTDSEIAQRVIPHVRKSE